MIVSTWTSGSSTSAYAGAHALKRVRPLRDPLADLNTLSWTRQNEHYRQVLGLARVVLENSMADIGGGSVSTVGFNLRLHEVFERFMRTALREAAGHSLAEFPDSWKGKGLSLAHSGFVHVIPEFACGPADGGD